MPQTPFKVLLTTSGTGSRLGELTKATNKALVEIAGQPAVSYIVDSYPEEAEFVVTVGYLADQVREALPRLHPDRKFTFVDIDLYEGPGSSLGYSMLAARDLLQCPFVFHACDTIIDGQVPAPDQNWIAGFRVEDSSQYRTLNVKGDTVAYINDKGAPNFDYIHIGLVGIAGYQSFWRHMTDLYTEAPEYQALNDTLALNRMLDEGTSFNFIRVNAWYDTGNPAALAETASILGGRHA